MERKAEKRTSRRKRDKSLVVKTDFRDLLPAGFKLEAPAVALVSREQQAVYQDRSELSFSEVMDRTGRILSPNPQERAEKEIALARKALFGTEIALKNKDPLEEYREKLGLVAKREWLMNQLFKELSAQEGLEVFSQTAFLLTGKRYSNMAEVNQDYPHLTQTEMALLSLLDTAPTTFIEFGRTNPLPVKAGEKQVNHKLVPLMAGGSVHGLLFINELTDPNKVYVGDSYSQLGITGANESVETVGYKPKISLIIKELLPLVVSNYRLHERVWNKADSALLDGISKIDRFALSKVLSQQSDDQPLYVLRRQLTHDQKLKWDEQKQKIDIIFGQNILVDLQKGIPLETNDVVKLIGLLDKLPEMLLDENQPFEGFFTPYGPGLLFLDRIGNPVFYTSYNPYYLREAMQGLYSEQIDVGRDNRSIAMIFNDLAKQAEGLVYEAAAEKEEDPSLLEGTRIELKLSRNTDLDITPQTKLEVADWGRNFFQWVTKIVLTPTLKFSAAEAEQILNTTRLLAFPLVSDVSVFRKKTKDDFVVEEMLSGFIKQAKFDRHDKSVSVYQHPNYPYVFFNPEAQALRAFVIVHEISHSIWERLPEEDKTRWSLISWDEVTHTFKDKNGFLTMYAHIENEIEDFCDHLPSFVLHNSEFLEKASKNAILKEKHLYLEELISRLSGRKVEFPYKSPWTIEQITGAVEQQIESLKEEDLIRIEETKRERDEIKARRKRAKVSYNMDEGKVEDIIDEEEEYPFDDDEDLDFTNREIEEGITLVKEATEKDFDDVDDEILKEEQDSFKRNNIHLILDCLSSYLPVDDAIKLSKQIYQLLETDDFKDAMSQGRPVIEDIDDFSEFKETLESIKEAIDRN